MPEKKEPIPTESRITVAGGLVGAMLFAAAFITSATRILEDTVRLREVVLSTPNVILLTFFGFLFIASVVTARRALRAPSRFRDPEAFQARFLSGDALIGREADLRELESACIDHREVHLRGETGVGKTALIQALVARLQTRGRLTPVYVGTLSGDFINAPADRLREQLRHALPVEERQNLPEDLDALIEKVRDVTGGTPLLIFDHLDAYQLEHHQRLLNAAGEPISREQLVASNSFWAMIESQLSRRAIHVLFACRSAFTPLTSDAFDIGQHRLTLDEVRLFLQNAIANDGTAPAAERGWTDLVDTLSRDLSDDERIVPRQLVHALSEVVHLPRLTLTEYEISGGLHGLVAKMIDREINEMARTRHVDVATLREAVRAVGAGQQPLLNAHLGSAFADLERAGVLVRQLKAGRVLWKPADPLISSSINQIGAPLHRWSRVLEIHSARHRRAHGPLQWWTTLLPVSTQVVLAAHRIHRRLQYSSYRGYAAISTLRFVPYAIPVLLILYIAAAEHRWPIPFAGYFGNVLYGLGFELTKHTPLEQDVAAAAQKARTILVGHILSRERENWIQNDDREFVVREGWNHAQGMAALSQAHDARVTPKLLRYGDELFTIAVSDTNGKPYGWLLKPDAVHTSAEPVLWATSAFATMWPNVTNEDQRHIDRHRFLHEAAKLYGPQRSGGWNMFPNQVDPTLHSTYTSALALATMLDVRSVAVDHTSLRWPDSQIEQKIEKTAQWLIRTYDTRSKGWAPAHRDPKIDEGLTLQVFATLLRAANEARINLPASIVRDAADRMGRLADVDVALHEKESFTSIGRWHEIPLVNHLGKQVPSDLAMFRYAWYPWAIECGTQWLKYSSHTEMPVWLIGRVRRARDHLVVDAAENTARVYTHKPTFVASELLYCLASIPPPVERRSVAKK